MGYKGVFFVENSGTDEPGAVPVVGVADFIWYDDDFVAVCPGKAAEVLAVVCPLEPLVESVTRLSKEAEATFVEGFDLCCCWCIAPIGFVIGAFAEGADDVKAAGRG